MANQTSDGSARKIEIVFTRILNREAADHALSIISAALQKSGYRYVVESVTAVE